MTQRAQSCEVMIQPLSVLFAPRPRLEVLRALVLRSEPMTGRRLARAAGVGHQSCWAAIRAFADIGILSVEPCGTSARIVLRQDHPLVLRLLRPLFIQENRLTGEIRSELDRTLEGIAATVEPGDLVCGTKETVVEVLPCERERVSRLLDALSAGLDERCDALAGFRVRGFGESD